MRETSDFEKRLNSLKQKAQHLTLLDSNAQRIAYERDANVLLRQEPRLIALPKNALEVAEVVLLCHQLDLPFTTRGAGTGLAAGSVPHSPDCIMISTAQLNRIHHIDLEAFTVHVEAGVVNAVLNEALKSHGVMYAPDPSSQKACTLGGNWAANAGGVHCIGYGVTTDHIHALRVVSPEGELFWTHPLGEAKTLCPLSSAFNSLYCGSEGTLGILTEAVLKLTPIPQHVGVALIGFASVETAMEAVSSLTEAGLAPKAVEFMDAMTIRCVNQAFHVGLPEEAEGVLLVELAYYYSSELEEGFHRLDALVKSWNPLSYAWETQEARRQALWQARKGAVASYGQLSPMFYVLDSVIPRQALPHVLKEIEAISERVQLPIANVFHAGDGNLHPHLMFDSNAPEVIARVKAGADAIFDLCLEVGGVLSGEHGIGLEKIGHMPQQFNPVSLSAQEAISMALDAKGLANPGKQIPRKGCCGESHGQAMHLGKGLSVAGVQKADLWI
jgi:glycolate oxidase